MVFARAVFFVILFFLLGSCSTVHNYTNGWEAELADRTAVIRKTTMEETVRICNYRFKIGAFPPLVFLGACTAWGDSYDEGLPDIEVIISDWDFLKHELYQAAVDWVNVGHRDLVMTEWPAEAIFLESEASAEGFEKLWSTLKAYDRQDFIVSFVKPPEHPLPP
ncbi:MAG: hypothetical protein HYS74_00820 [Parcubacteria group bacterium]|nr:hypothetical protein [Parcubacteria group bacterium]